MLNKSVGEKGARKTSQYFGPRSGIGVRKLARQRKGREEYRRNNFNLYPLFGYEGLGGGLGEEGWKKACIFDFEPYQSVH